MNTQITFVDLFCGMGSFHYSFGKLGWKCIMACDINEAARDTYHLNYNVKTLSDIHDIDPTKLPRYDILCSGFPCKSFSTCGCRKGFSDNETGDLFFETMRFVRANRPKVTVFENVPGLVYHKKGKTLQRIISVMETEGYRMIYKLLMCSDYGIPQMRKRVFIVGVRKDIALKVPLQSLLDFGEFEKRVTLSEFFGRRFAKEVASTLRCTARGSPFYDIHNWDGYLVDGKEYRLVLGDALMLQGFPKDFPMVGSSAQKWKMVGNTIPTNFTRMIAHAISTRITLKKRGRHHDKLNLTGVRKMRELLLNGHVSSECVPEEPRRKRIKSTISRVFALPLFTLNTRGGSFLRGKQCAYLRLVHSDDIIGPIPTKEVIVVGMNKTCRSARATYGTIRCSDGLYIPAIPAPLKKNIENRNETLVRLRYVLYRSFKSMATNHDKYINMVLGHIGHKPLLKIHI